MCTHGGVSNAQAYAARRGSGVGRAGDISGFSARTNLVEQVSVLSLLRKLEVSGHEVAVAGLQTVAQFLYGVGVD